jgi:hypothetical protein
MDGRGKGGDDSNVSAGISVRYLYLTMALGNVGGRGGGVPYILTDLAVPNSLSLCTSLLPTTLFSHPYIHFCRSFMPWIDILAEYG